MTTQQKRDLLPDFFRELHSYAPPCGCPLPKRSCVLGDPVFLETGGMFETRTVQAMTACSRCHQQRLFRYLYDVYLGAGKVAWGDPGETL